MIYYEGLGREKIQ